MYYWKYLLVFDAAVGNPFCSDPTSKFALIASQGNILTQPLLQLNMGNSKFNPQQHIAPNQRYTNQVIVGGISGGRLQGNGIFSSIGSFFKRLFGAIPKVTSTIQRATPHAAKFMHHFGDAAQSARQVYDAINDEPPPIKRSRYTFAEPNNERALIPYSGRGVGFPISTSTPYHSALAQKTRFH